MYKHGLPDLNVAGMQDEQVSKCTKTLKIQLNVYATSVME